MEDKITTKKQPNLPPNYVTLAQLQERWLKQKEKEEEKLEAEPQQAIRRNSNRNLSGACIKESNAVLLEENGSEKSEVIKKKKKKKKKKKRRGEARALEELTTGSVAHEELLVKCVGCEQKREMGLKYRAKVEKMVEEDNQMAEIEKEIGDRSIEKESEKPKKQNNRVINVRNSYANGGGRNYRVYNGGGDRGNGQYREARALEELTTGSEAHEELLVKSVGYEQKREMQVEYRAKVEKMVDENNQMAEIEKEIVDLSIGKESEKSKKQNNRVINGRNSYANGGGRNYRGYNGGGDRGNGQYRGGHGRFNSNNGRYGGGHVRFNGSEQWKERDNGKVWVKKEEVAGGGCCMVGNQSSSGSLLKGLE